MFSRGVRVVYTNLLRLKADLQVGCAPPGRFLLTVPASMLLPLRCSQHSQPAQPVGYGLPLALLLPGLQAFKPDVFVSVPLLLDSLHAKVRVLVDAGGMLV